MASPIASGVAVDAAGVNCCDFGEGRVVSRLISAGRASRALIVVVSFAFVLEGDVEGCLDPDKQRCTRHLCLGLRPYHPPSISSTRSH